ncbi:MAG: choice-of-anchor tandem repeat NxxGxxAF-containing protein, partial [Planctomycetota bacterium]
FSEAAGSPGMPALIAGEGNPAPGTPTGVNYSGVNPPVMNGSGQAAFFAFLAGAGVDSTNNRGIFSDAAGSPGIPGLVVRAGEAAPGAAPGVNYIGFDSPVLNGAGQTAFRAFLTGPGVDNSNNTGIFSEATGSLGAPGLIAREGDAAPDTPAGVNFNGFAPPAINAAGQTVFRAFLTGAGVDSTNDSAIFSEAAGSTGTPGLVAREGDAVPGTAPGINFSSFSDPVINGSGQTAFLAGLIGSSVTSLNNSGIFSEAAGSPGAPGLVARAGDAAPSVPPGVNFRNFGSPTLNDAGQVAFFATVTGPGVDFTTDRGVWATTPNGLLTLIIREGDLFDVDDDPFVDDFRTVSTVNVLGSTGSDDGRPSYFNNAGQLAFRATFADGSSGIFIANVIPEPASMSLVAVSSLTVLLRRRREKA